MADATRGGAAGDISPQELSDDARLASLGYRPQLNRVVGYVTALVTLLAAVYVAVVGAVVFFALRPDRRVVEHLHDDVEPTGAGRL